MGFWVARARTNGAHALVAILACVAVSASAASAVSVSLPSSISISAAGQNTSVNMTIGSVSNLEAVAVSFTYDSTIVSVPAGGVTVPAGSLISTCSSPVINIDNASMPGRVTITLACVTAVSGSGTLFSVAFHGVANGTSPLEFSPTAEVLNGCQLNEGTPTCEPSPNSTSPGQIVVGPVVATSTATATGASTATRTATAVATATRTATATATLVATSTTTVTATNTVTPVSTATRTNTPTVTDTPTTGPSATPSQTSTASSTATVTLTPSTTSTPSTSPTATNTPPPSATATTTLTPTTTATFTATPVPQPVIVSGAVGGSTRVFGHGAANLASGGIEIIAVNGNQVIGSGGTNGTGAFFDGALGIGLTRALVAGEQIFAVDTVNSVTGPTVTVGPQPPANIPTLDAHGIVALGVLLGLALLLRLAIVQRRRG